MWVLLVWKLHVWPSLCICLWAYPRSGRCWRLFCILKVPTQLSSRAKYFQTQQLGWELLQNKNPGHVPFPSSQLHWFTKHSRLEHCVLFLLTLLGAMVLWRGYNSPADWGLQTGVTEGQSRHCATLEGDGKSLVGVPFLGALWATELFMVSPYNSTIGGCKAAVLRTMPFCVAVHGKVHPTRCSRSAFQNSVYDVLIEPFTDK